jgi:regulator of PEP synthase PpsR (kinase-PPPase family)
MGASKQVYAGLVSIYEELEYAEAVQRKLGCPVIDISNLSIEETAHKVVRLVEQRRLDHRKRTRA